MDKLCRLTANFQNEKHKIKSNIFEKSIKAEEQ